MKKRIEILLLCSLLFGCTQVEVCPEEEHPHSSILHVDLDFADNDARKPESVQVIASRIVNTWRYAFTLLTGLVPVVPETPEETDIHMKSGEYTFFFVGQNENLEVEGLDTYINDYSYSMRDMYLSVKKVAKTEVPELEGVDWVDFNPGQTFINYKGPVFKDQQHNVSLYTGKEATIRADMQLVTQEITVDFGIKLEGNVVVTDVIAEISGVAYRVNLFNSSLDAAHTGRIIFLPEIKEAEPGKLNCHGMFEVLGLISSKNQKYVTGPGIMQLAIYVEAEGKKKIFHAGINLMKSINDAGLTQTVQDGNYEYITTTKRKGALKVEQELTINAQKIIEWEEEEGFDVWYDSQDIDIEA